jgi:hypothetical protein
VRLGYELRRPRNGKRGTDVAGIVDQIGSDVTRRVLHTPVTSAPSFLSLAKRVDLEALCALVEAGGLDPIVTDDDPSPEGYDGVIVGDSIHLGRHSRSLRCR